MEYVVSWASFIGSWLLVAGSIYQASLELSAEDIERDKIAAVGTKMEPIPHVSSLWWFVPPIKYIKELKRRRRFKRAFLQALEPEDLEAFVSFTNKALGWFLVAGGGFLIALKETFELYAFHSIPLILYFVIVLILLVASIGFTVFRTRSTEKLIANKVKK